MTSWDAQVDEQRDRFLQGLADAGFKVQDAHHATGNLHVPALARDIPLRIDITDDFPYEPPHVFPEEGDGGTSWHRERNGRLCLYSQEGSGDLAWTDVPTLLGQIERWFTEDSKGWPDDPPDLDLERYWDATGGLLIYGDLDDLEGAPMHVVRRDSVVAELRVGKAENGASPARVIDVGELAAPPLNWFDLSELTANADDIDRRLRAGPLDFLVVRYTRQGHQGVLALRVDKRDPIELAAMQSAHVGDRTMRLRAGSDAEDLKEMRVAVVGLGAVGGYVADLLSRAGAGHLTLVDGDWFRPGNQVRHILDGEWIGVKKARAMKGYLLDDPWHPTVDTIDTHLTSRVQAEELLAEHDLVIDATGASRPSHLLLDGSAHTGRPLLSVCVQRGGGIVRIDRAPLAGAEAWLPATPDLPGAVEEHFEASCGDPVSPTPAWACTAAASLAVAVAVDILAGRVQYGPTTINVLLAQPDAPYDVVGRLG